MGTEVGNIEGPVWTSLVCHDAHGGSIGGRNGQDRHSRGIQDEVRAASASLRDVVHLREQKYASRRSRATKGTRCNYARDRKTVSELQSPESGWQADEARRFRRQVAGSLRVSQGRQSSMP